MVRDNQLTRMPGHTQAMGANAIPGVRENADEVMDGSAEDLEYGTAVVVKKG